MIISTDNKTKLSDEKQKDYLRSLGYSEKVIAALFPEWETMSCGGENLIEGFVIAAEERLLKKILP